LSSGWPGTRLGAGHVRLLTTGSLPPRLGGGAHGGVATFHASLLDGLRRPGSGVEVVGTVAPAASPSELGVPVHVRPDGVQTADFYEQVLDRVRPDAVLMNHFAHTIGITHARLHGAPPAVGIAHSWHNVTLRSGEERSHAARVTSEAMGGLGAVVFGSHHTRREGEALGLPYPALARTIYLPLQPFYAEGDLDVGVAERRGVTFLGSLVERKNPLALAEAAAAMPGLEVCFAGHGDLEQPLLSLVRSHSLGDRVRVVHLADPEIRDLLLRSQVMCLPSSSETFGLAYIEALACGTPVVGFGPTVREIREEMGIEIGEPLDGGAPEEIATAIEKVRATTWDRQLLRRAAIEAFGVRRIADRYVELLSEVVDASAAGAKRE
jgi:glycosyltransferase involved in cell wall biosynthesis